MFTGIIEERGRIVGMAPRSHAGTMAVQAHKVLEDTAVGDSIAVNGVCLTVVEIGPDRFCADVMPETLRTSSLGQLAIGDHVNLERAMAAGKRFGGHIVSGHIDGCGRVRRIRKEQNAHIVTVEAPADIMKLVVDKGSIAIDGVSLTVAHARADAFDVSIIPHTGAETSLLDKRPGDPVNLENDIIGKYVEKLLHGELNSQNGITLGLLEENGF